MKQKTLGQIARDKYDDVHGEPRRWSREYVPKCSWEKIAAAVIRAYERRKPCRECAKRNEQVSFGGCVCDYCRWAYESQFKRRERKG